MSIHEPRTTTESTDTDSPEPRNGLAQALWEADPDTPIEELPKLLDDVERWVCTGCGRKNFTKPERCGCGSATFDRVVPSGGDEADE